MPVDYSRNHPQGASAEALRRLAMPLDVPGPKPEEVVGELAGATPPREIVEFWLANRAGT